MKPIIKYIQVYFKEVDKTILVIITLQTALLIFLNFRFGLEKSLTQTSYLPCSAFTGHYLLFLFAFGTSYAFYFLIKKKNYFTEPLFCLLLLLAPAIFALKMSMDTTIHFSGDKIWNDYWNEISYWPIRVLTLTATLFVTWKIFHRDQPFYGLTNKNFNWKPYIIMLLIMLPLIAAASTQPDFLSMYPKMKAIFSLPANTKNLWFYRLLFELSYGSDFFSIELFFRGFLILAFIKWAGKDAILPMACFYCTIHFGKPLGECISSYFGGILLGIVIYHTKSIYGGLMVHLGIAWLMELGGYVGGGLMEF